MGTKTMDGDEEIAVVKKVVEEAAAEFRVKNFRLDTNLTNIPRFLYKLVVPISNGSYQAREMFNGILHRLGLLPEGEKLDVGDVSRYCQIERCYDSFYALFNQLCDVREDGSSGFILQNYRERDWFKQEKVEFESLMWYRVFDDIDHETTMEETLKDIKEGRLKAKSPQEVCILSPKMFDEFARGERSLLEYEFNLHDIKCTIGVKTMLLHQGFCNSCISPRQMRFEVARTMLVDEDGNECDPFNVPDDFWPTGITVHLGQRLDCPRSREDSCYEDRKYLLFHAWDSYNERPYIGCIGSLGELRKLCFKDSVGDSVRFLLYTDSGVYGIAARGGHEPCFHAMCFLDVWREDVFSLHEDEIRAPDEYRVLLFNPQIAASIEKAVLAPENYSRIDAFSAGDEIEILDLHAALEYLKTKTSILESMIWAHYGLERIMWCDKDGRPLCEKRADYCKMAEFDSCLLNVCSDESGFRGILTQTFMSSRYNVYAAIRNGVVKEWNHWPM